MRAPIYLKRLFVRPGAVFEPNQFPGTLPFAKKLDIRFTHPVTFFVGENGSGKSTVIEAIAEVCRLPVGGGGGNELADFRGAPQRRSELAPFLRPAFQRRPPDGYFFRAEFQAHFASLLEQRRDDPEFGGDPFARYGGRSLHTRSHGEAFLAMFSAWMTPGLIVMDEPESALSPQRQLSLLTKMSELVRHGGVQFIIATHSPVLMTFPGAKLLSFDDGRIKPMRLEDTAHYQITHGILDDPQQYWQHLASDEPIE